MSPTEDAQAAIRRARFAGAVAEHRDKQDAIADARAVVVESAREAAARGVPIAELARIAGVTRHTIYAWISPLEAHAERVIDSRTSHLV